MIDPVLHKVSLPAMLLIEAWAPSAATPRRGQNKFEFYFIHMALCCLLPQRAPIRIWNDDSLSPTRAGRNSGRAHCHIADTYTI